MLKKFALASSLVALALFAFTGTQASAGLGSDQCGAKSSGCKATDITFTPDSNPTPPFPPCAVTLYRVEMTITCGMGSGDNVSGYVCPSTSQPLVIQLNGQTHTFQPDPGYDWEDVANDCSVLDYSVS